MRATDLMVGKPYVLDHPHGVVAVYMGKHERVLKLDDGASLVGVGNTLRFERTLEDGAKEVLVVASGAEVKEAAETKVAREAEQATRKANQDAAVEAAHKFMTGLGFTLDPDRYRRHREAGQYYLDSVAQTLDEVRLDNFTIGDLKLAIARAQPQG